jgi:hypothetical protein
MATSAIDSRTLAERLDPLIRTEIASIGAIEAATKQQEEPAYVFLYQAAKTGKQANVDQMATLLRMNGLRPSEKGGVLETVARLQTSLAQKVSTTATLKAMRLVEERLVADYRALVGATDEQSLEGRALRTVMERAVKHWHVLTAHIAKRERDDDEASRLPFPLSDYFVGDGPRACMRCHFDRAGEEPAVEKTDPHPYTFVCSACLDEVFEDLPPDLERQAGRWPDEVRRDRLVERAIGRPEKLRAMKEVVAVLSGLTPQLPTPAARSRTTPIAPRGVAPPVARATPILTLPREGASEGELAYTDLLFDFASVRRSW